MKTRLFLPMLVTLGLAGGAGWYIRHTLDASLSPAAAAAGAAEPGARTVSGPVAVVVSPEAQRASGIEVAPLVTVFTHLELSAYATVIDPQPLFSLRSQLATARANLDGLRAQADDSRAQYERSLILYQDDRNISQKALQAAKTRMRADQAKLRSAETTQSGLAATMRLRFGDALAHAAMDPGSTLFKHLLANRAAVLRVTFSSFPGSAAPPRVTIDWPSGSVAADLLSAAPRSDPAIQGVSYLYAAESALPTDTHTIAQASAPNSGHPALVIPERAIVWYGGQPWAYIRTGEDRFTRRRVPPGNAGMGGYIVTSGFRAGDLVVTQGAQLLLSEELRPQGIATACKDPPECDG